MISRLSLRNFQSHKTTDLDLHPGVNVIIGSSDSGKSAIIRGLRWLVWNRPGGDGFRSTWGGETSVVATLREPNGSAVDVEVSRIRSNKENSYWMSYPGMPAPPQAEFKAFGAEPPEEIVLTLNLDEVNLQSQLARPFLLDSSPGQVAQYLNGVARLDVIDYALSSINKWIRALDGDCRAKHQRIEELEAAAGEFAYLPDMEQAIAELEAKDAKLQAKKDVYRRLRATVSHLVQVEKGLDSSRQFVDLKPLVTTALVKYDEVKALRTERDRVQTLVGRLRNIDERREHLASLKALKPAVEKVSKVQEKIESKTGQIAKLAGIIHKVKQNEREKTDLAGRIGAMRKAFDKEMGERCILCGAKR